MLVSRTIKKGAEPAVAIPVIVYALQIASKPLDADLSPESAAVVAGFLYGVYRSIRNFAKNRFK